MRETTGKIDYNNSITGYKKKYHEQHWITAIFFLGVIFIVYSNSISAPWQLDDLPNIVENKKLHMEKISPGAVIQTFFTSQNNADKLYRPVPCFTFALNWYFGKDKVEGYHLVNIFIHFLTSFFLFLTLFNLLRTPVFFDRYKKKEYGIAITAALFWALNPIQTQAVTYIVQRMAAMTTLFTIIGVYCYIMAQKQQNSTNRRVLYTGCGVSFLLALGSKENAILFPFSLLLIKMLFFPTEKRRETNLKDHYVVLFILALLMLSATAYFLKHPGFSILDAYDEKSFTMMERLLTEPRIIIFYISQLFYPVANRLSIEHDIIVSTSLFHPWTTLPSILFILLAVGTGFFLIKKNPLLSIAILFFFLNHLIESTFLPLELIFEHRNYLPSLFLFLPVAVYLNRVSDYFKTKNPKIKGAVNCFIALLIAMSGISSHIRNMAWASETALWEDAMGKAPNRARPLFMVAKYRYYLKGDLDTANGLYQRAFHANASTPDTSKAICLNGMAGIAFKKNDYDTAVFLSYQALEYDSASREAKFNIVLALLKNNKFNDSMAALEKFYGHIPNHEVYLNFKGLILLGQNRAIEAIPFFDTLLKTTPEHWRSILNKGIALSRSGNVHQADRFLRKACAMNPGDINALFFLLENSIKTRDDEQIKQDLKTLTSKFDINHIASGINGKFKTGFTPVLAKNIVWPVIYHNFSSKRSSDTPEAPPHNRNNKTMLK